MDTAQLVVSILVVLVFFWNFDLKFCRRCRKWNTERIKRGCSRLLDTGVWFFLFLTGIALVSAISTRQVYYELSSTKRPKKDTKWLYFSIAILPLLIAGGYFVINAKRIPAFLLPP